MDLEDLNYVIAQRDRFSPKFLYPWFFTPDSAVETAAIQTLVRLRGLKNERRF
jgi:hypothetical protein